jgi:hypothetical protein
MVRACTIIQERRGRRCAAAAGPHPGAVLAGMVASLAVVLACSLARSTIAQVATGNRLYTLAEVRAHLRDGPSRWVGRTVRLRAMLMGCQQTPSNLGWASCAPVPWQPVLTDPAGPGAVNPLPVRWGGPDPLLASLRAMPLVGRFVPGPQTARWGVLATYRVRLTVAAAHTLCLSTVCYEAVLLDT